MAPLNFRWFAKLGSIQSWTLPIRGGPLRGYRWAPVSGGKVLRFLAGNYENSQTEIMVEMLKKGDVVFDIGAAQGWYSLMFSKIVGETGKVFSFEPKPTNTFFLRRHLKINHCENSQIFDCALGNRNGRFAFSEGTGSGTGKLSESGTAQVNVRRLDSIVLEQDLIPNYLKIDVEGTEFDVLKGAEETLKKHRPVIFLSTHGHKAHQDCCQFLTRLDYALHATQQNAKQGAWNVLCH